MKALISETHALPADYQDRLKQLGLDFDVIEETNLVKDPSQYDVVFGANHVKRLGLDKFAKLKWIQSSYAGFNNLPVEEWKAKGIVFTNARDVFSEPIAEHVVLYILMAYKRALEVYHNQVKHHWDRLENRELGNQNICIVGIGSIGQAIQKRLKGFNVHMIGVNSQGRSVDGFDHVYPVRELKTAVAMSDVVVITLPLNEQTDNLFNEDVLKSMKKDALLINVGRGKIIDEEALMQALNLDQLGACVLDVMAVEPLPKDSPLWDTKNLLITPHNSGTGALTLERLYTIFEQNLYRYAHKQELINIV